jgi:pimeloyl-ACP methyl ester carboxylesterase
MSSQTLTLPDGRQLGFAFEGESEPIVYFHGTASSRLEIELLKQFAFANHFKLIGVDRPGFGLSTFKNRLRLRDFAADVDALADHLGLSKFSVLSWSGGGPFALAYVALCPRRVTRAVVVGSPCLPFDPAMAHNGNPFAKFAMNVPFVAKWALGAFRKSVLNVNRDTEGYLASRKGKNMVASWPKPDARFFADPAWLTLMYHAMAEGFRQNAKSVEAIYQEHRLFMKPWSEPIQQIPTGKLIIMQGSQDKTCPLSNAQKITKLVRGTHLEIFQEEGHCVMFSKPEALYKCLRGQQ